MRIMAIDPATTTGVCIGHAGDRPQLSSHKFREDKDDEPENIFGRATFWLADCLSRETFDLIAIEAPFPSQNFATSMIALGLFGIFTGIAKCKSIPITRVQISVWRKYFLSSGRMPGPQAKKESLRVCEALGWDTSGHDSAEAAGIWTFACSQAAPQSVQRVEPIFIQRGEQKRA